MSTYEYASVLKEKTASGLHRETVGFAKRLGFETVSAFCITERPNRKQVGLMVDNTPTCYSEIYRDAAVGLVCPVLNHCKTKDHPLIWCRETYLSVGLLHVWEEQAAYGFCTGIATAMRQPGGKRFLIGVDRDKPLPTDQQELWRLVSELQLFTAYAQEVAASVSDAMASSAETNYDHIVLSSREREALKWTMNGKTAWEVGLILGISERTAATHVRNAATKLGCYTKHQAVVKALKLGLI